MENDCCATCVEKGVEEEGLMLLFYYFYNFMGIFYGFVLIYIVLFNNLEEINTTNVV